MLSDIILSDHQIAILLIKEKMFKNGRRKNNYRLYIDPKILNKHIDCPSSHALRAWLRGYYEDHPKGAPWNIDPEMALEITQHFGLA